LYGQLHHFLRTQPSLIGRAYPARNTQTPHSFAKRHHTSLRGIRDVIVSLTLHQEVTIPCFELVGNMLTYLSWLCLQLKIISIARRGRKGLLATDTPEELLRVPAILARAAQQIISSLKPEQLRV
jgi:hypothetical protein